MIKMIALCAGIASALVVALCAAAVLMWPNCPTCHVRAAPSSMIKVCIAAPVGHTKPAPEVADPFWRCPKCYKFL